MGGAACGRAGPGGGGRRQKIKTIKPAARGRRLLNPKDLDAMVTDVRYGKKAVGAKG